jgi:hypothetical protein
VGPRIGLDAMSNKVSADPSEIRTTVSLSLFRHQKTTDPCVTVFVVTSQGSYYVINGPDNLTSKLQCKVIIFI